MKTRARGINAFNYRSSRESWGMIFVSCVTKKDIDLGPVLASTWDTLINRLAWTQADVKCEICGERSHPTSDCPRKGVNKEAYMTSEYNKMLSDMG